MSTALFSFPGIFRGIMCIDVARLQKEITSYPLNLRVLICSEQKNVYASAVYIKGTKDYYLHCTIRRY